MKITANMKSHALVGLGIMASGASNLRLSSDLSLTSPNDTVTLIYDGTNWLLKSFADNN